MDENTWRIVQIGMWVIGIQTAFISSLIGFAWLSLNKKFEKVDQRFEYLEKKIDSRFDKLEEKVTDIDRRLCRLEGAFSSKDCCMIKDDRQIKKTE